MSNNAAVTIERVFTASPQRVFSAWTRAKDLQQWAWGSLSNDVSASVDLRIGGDYEITTKRPDADVWTCFGTYEEIESERRLVYTIGWSAPMGYDSEHELVEVEFEETIGGTRLRFRHSGIPEVACAEHERGWNNTFDHLEKLLGDSP